jgi:3-hydroxybenzoate 6-monooxygenase
VASGRERNVLIVGGGLGGLAAALALAHRGFRVRVLEQAREISPIGYGIQLGPNVFKVFEKIGIADHIRSISGFPPALVMPDADSGEVLMHIPLANDTYRRRFAHPYVVLHRADIHGVLLGACLRTPGVELVVNASVDHFEQADDGEVRAHCADGRQFAGDLLIGADGLNSRVRSLLLNDERPPRRCGYVAHRTIVDMRQVPKELKHRHEVVLWAGPGYHVVHYPLRKESIFNIVAVFKDPQTGDAPRGASHLDEVKQVYARAHPTLKKILSMMDLERRWVIADRDPIRQWTSGRVTLLGDAAHPTLQSYAQGAGMALEDALSIAELLAHRGVDDALAEYPRRRGIRTARIQLNSRLLWEFYHAEGIARDVRNVELSERSENSFHDCLAWIWNGDPQFGEPLTAREEAVGSVIR